MKLHDYLDPRHHANGVPEPANTGERFRAIQAAVFKAAGLFTETSEGDLNVTPKMVKIRMHHGAVVEVNHDTAVQRILQSQAELVA